MSKIVRYEIESEIGRGTMGVVYLAHDPRLQRRVAVKTYTLPQGLSRKQKAEFQKRFLREAQAAAGLSHRGIVTVYDAGEDPERNVPYIAMEYVPGKTLQQVLQAEGPFALDRAVTIAGILAEALQVAHEAGIVHRDIKPANILVRESDEAVKIADFGVARLSTSTLTQSGASIGSPAYMSPEQVRGRTTDGRSDLFSLAVMLYELLCGTRPFTGEDPTAVLYSVAHETPVPITKRTKDLPARLNGFFEKALAKDPNDRFRDGKSFKRALDEASQAIPSIDVEATVQEAARVIEPIAPVSAGSPAQSAPPAMPLPDLESYGVGPSRRRMLLAAVILFLVALGGWAFFGGNNDAYLKLDAKSGVVSGRLTLVVDGEEVYRRQLSAPRNKQGFFKKVLKQNVETFEALIEVTAGRHEIVAHVLPTGETAAYQDTIVIDLQPGETRTLKMSAGGIFGPALSLRAY